MLLGSPTEPHHKVHKQPNIIIDINNHQGAALYGVVEQTVVSSRLQCQTVKRLAVPRSSMSGRG